MPAWTPNSERPCAPRGLGFRVFRRKATTVSHLGGTQTSKSDDHFACTEAKKATTVMHFANKNDHSFAGHAHA